MKKLFLNIELKSLPYFFEYLDIRYFDKFKNSSSINTKWGY